MRGANGARPRRARLAPLRTPRRRGQPAPAADRPHRPLPAARARRRDADRGDAVGAHRPGPRGQGRATSAARTSPAGRSPTPTGPRARRGSSGSSPCRTATRCSTAPSRTRSCRRARRSGSGVLPYFPLEYGLLTGKYRRGEARPGRLARRRSTRAARSGCETPTGTGSRRSTTYAEARDLSDPRRRDRRPRRPAGRRVGDLRAPPRATRSAPTPPRCAGSRPTSRPRRARRDHRAEPADWHAAQATCSDRFDRPIQKPSMTCMPGSSGSVAAPRVTNSGV